MKRLLSIACVIALCVGIKAKVTTYDVQSPNGQLTMSITIGDGPISYSLRLGDTPLMQDAKASLTLGDGRQVGVGAKVKSRKQRHINKVVETVLYRQRYVNDQANELNLLFADGYGLVCRAYDQGVAYRFYSTRSSQTIKDEQADFRFADDYKAYLAYTTNDKRPMAMAFQNFYDEVLLSEAKDKIAFLPVTVDCGMAKVTLLESDIEAYPGMFVESTKADNTLKATFAPYPTKTDFYPWRQQLYVTETADFIAQFEHPRALPWRIMAVTTCDEQMPVNDLCYLLASESRVKDTTWIRGGLVAWDWWNDWNLKGVDFEAGINMDTYRYYIDFAARYGLSYIILDEGWYDPKSGDMLTVVPQLDLPQLIAYGKSKGVDIILWTVFNVLDNQLEEACKRYSEMGIAGFKVDFLDRNDQTAAEMTYRLCEACARYRLTLDLHGFYPPMGITRTWPNVINIESVFGMEEMKWSEPSVDMPHYDVSFPFIRQMCGPTDYTPGAMRNGTKKNWTARYDMPVSQGTRCHQLASYVVVDSHLTMLADSPTSYEADPTITSLLAQMPTRPDTTVIMSATLGESIVTARRQAGRWYVGGQTDWTPREACLTFDFLPRGKTYKATLCRDGINAGHNAEDYKIEQIAVDHDTHLNVQMASGGGFVMIIQ